MLGCLQVTEDTVFSILLSTILGSSPPLAQPKTASKNGCLGMNHLRIDLVTLDNGGDTDSQADISWLGWINFA